MKAYPTEAAVCLDLFQVGKLHLAVCAPGERRRRRASAGVAALAAAERGMG